MRKQFYFHNLFDRCGLHDASHVSHRVIDSPVHSSDIQSRIKNTGLYLLIYSCDVIMSAMAFQITSIPIVYSIEMETLMTSWWHQISFHASLLGSIKLNRDSSIQTVKCSLKQSCFTCITAANLRQRLSNMNVIFNIKTPCVLMISKIFLKEKPLP